MGFSKTIKDERALNTNTLPNAYYGRALGLSRPVLIALSLGLVAISIATVLNFIQLPSCFVSLTMASIAAWCSRVAALFSASPQPVSAPHMTDLSGFNWTLTNQNGSITVPGKVPSSVHLDLYAAKVITDPYYGQNDYDLRWITNSNWTYSAVIAKPKPKTKAWLLFNGLDTFTSITLCDKHVASTNNQFRQYYFDVTGIFEQCSGPANLTINFGSAALIGEQIANLPDQETWPSGVEGLFEYEHRQFVRKEQNDFGWDWGPAFVPSGVWQPAYMLEFDPADVYVRNSLVDIHRKDQMPLLRSNQSAPWILHASLDLLGALPTQGSLKFNLRDSKHKLIANGTLVNQTISGQTVSGFTTISPNLVELWWPVGMGKQTLYDLNIDLVSAKGEIATSVNKRVGFRTVLLNQEPIRPDQIALGIAPGANWMFEVNGLEIYAKGSNFIPPDAFWTRVTKDRIQQLFNAVIKGNQNMLRIWSSGAYLPDFAYDIADELGLLLWSEFQFGDALYPADKEFLDNVREEARYQVRRLNHHPSLALWAGGNELENLELNMVRGSEDWDKYLAEYEALFLDVLAVTVFENSKSISYTPSSTSNGWQSLDLTKKQPIKQRYYNVTWGLGEIYGNTDHYNYDSGAAFTYSSYPVGRFSNEFGYHSMPSIQTWRQALDEKDLNFDSETLRLRNHHYPPGGLEKNIYRSDQGMEEMVSAVGRWYPIPNKKDATANFTGWCLATQIFQADYYSSQIQFYRRGSGKPERQLGSLYWQLEDIWQASTWAGIEYGGRWKMLHYVAKDVYENVIISPFYEDEKLEIYVTSDLHNPVDGIASFEWYDWSGKPLKTGVATNLTVPVHVGAINSTRVAQWKMSEVLTGWEFENAVLKMSTVVRGRRLNSQKDEEFKHENWYSASTLGKAKLVDPGMKLTHLEKEKKFRVEATKGVAAWVWIDYPAEALMTLSKNAFWLKPGEPVDIRYEVHSDDSQGKWIEKTTVQSIWDMTQP